MSVLPAHREEVEYRITVGATHDAAGFVSLELHCLCGWRCEMPSRRSLWFVNNLALVHICKPKTEEKT